MTIAGAKPKVPAYRRRRFSPNGGLARRVDGANLKDVFRRIDTNPHFCASSAQTRKRIEATPEKMAAPSDKDAEKRTVDESTPRD